MCDLVPSPSDTDDLLTRMTIIGIVMAFRKLTLEAMNAVLSKRTPFILNVITGFHDNPPSDSPEVCTPTVHIV